jgi:hypothetical protein
MGFCRFRDDGMGAPCVERAPRGGDGAKCSGDG